MLPESAKNRPGDVTRKRVENSLDSHKPVEIRDLRLLAIQERRGILGGSSSALKGRWRAADGPETGD